MANNPKYQHRIPKSYMKPWCSKEQSIYAYDKTTDVCRIRNIGNILGENYYYSFVAGSGYIPPVALQSIYGFLKNYKIQFNEKTIGDLEELNNLFWEFDNWVISMPHGEMVNKHERNRIKAELKQRRNNNVEKLWSKKYENDWQDFINKILKKLISDRRLTKTDIDLLMKYIIIFNWRSIESNNQFRLAFDLLCKEIIPLDEIHIPFNERLYNQDASMYDETKHEIQLKTANDFLEKDSGIMQKMLDLYKSNANFCFCITEKTDPFITSDNPSFVCDNEDGYKEHIFVALPELLVVLCKKGDETDSYRVLKNPGILVKKYNQIIYDYANLVLLPGENIKDYIINK
jgi:hypothetical protein